MNHSAALFSERNSDLVSSFSRTVSDGARQNRQSTHDLDYGEWDFPARLTFSIAPDTTPISSYGSTLYDSFSYLFDAAQLEQTIADAFQDWAEHSSLNFGLMRDSGIPFGSPGLNQGNPGFGDIRLGAIPLDDTVYAVAAPFDLGVSGSWAGDILFNSNAKFNSRGQFVSVLKHEIGHALGLEHSDHKLDVLNPESFNHQLSRNDVRILQSKYGVRSLDQYDSLDDDNDSIEDATRVRLAGSLKGQVPLIAFGDIHSSRDADFYEIDTYSDYQGDISFRLVSSEISLLAPTITVFDEDGNQLAFQSSRSQVGADLTITVAAPEDTLYVRVAAANVTNRQTGSYALTTLFDSDVQFDEQQWKAVLREDLWRLEQRDVHTRFLAQDSVFNDDLHTNDSLTTATVLEPLLTAELEDRFFVQAGIVNQVDRDFYKFSAPSRSGTTLTASLNSLEQFGLIGDLHFFDSNKNEIPAKIINNGNGRLVAQVSDIDPRTDYYVSVAARDPRTDFATGNYSLGISFQHSTYQLNALAEGGLSLRNNHRQIHTLFVAETQLFSFGASAVFRKGLGLADPSQTPSDAAIWTTLYAEDGTEIHRVVTRPGEFRTTQSVVLRPGTYSVRTNLTTRQPTKFIGIVDFSILGSGITDPMGPELLKPGSAPFQQCNPLTNEYCYPGDRLSPEPYLFITGNESNLASGATGPPTHDDVNMWYWYQNWTDDPIG